MRAGRHGATVAMTALLCAIGTAAPAPLAAPIADAAVQVARFRGTIDALWPEAERRGVSRAVFDAAFAGMAPDPGVAALTRRQPEFAKPIGAYLAAQVTPGRVAAGRALLARWSPELTAIERRYDVPRSIVVAIWGVESAFGTAVGGRDVIRSVATLAALGVRPDLYRTELLATLVLLQEGRVRREDLRGSWAGAMGQPQFMPSSFAAFAADGDGDGRPDIWTSVPDTLASIAHFLHAKGWRPGRPWGFEVRLPPGFDDRTSRAGGAEWAALGVTRPDGAPLPGGDDGVLFFPAGSAGPALMVTGNFEVLKTYNFSNAYALSVAQLADRMEGLPPIGAAWPSDPPMARDDRIALQARLVALGYPVDNREGRISLALRDVIRLAQSLVGLVPDGNPTGRLLRALRALNGP